MADGYVLLEVTTEGEFRVQGEQVNWFDFRLQDVCFFDAEGLDQLVSQLPDLKDCLVMVTFDYECKCSRDWEGGFDCDEEFFVTSHYIVKEGYKEFYRELITVELESFNDFNTEAKEDFYDTVIADWEEFYDEDFVPFKKQPKQINGVIDLWDLIKGKDF